jgi:hypothetical protein
MKKLFLLISTLFFSHSLAVAQEKTATQITAKEARQEVIAAVNTFFDYFHQRDTSNLRQTFYPKATLKSIKYNNGKPEISEDNIELMLNNIGKLPSNATFQEKLLAYEVQIDADLATVWTPYEFYFNGKFSHCGANAFTLVKINGKWLIVSIIDTRRKEKC